MRGKIKIEFIQNANARKAALKKRALAISKKASELQILCDVMVRFILFGLNGEVEVFPSIEAVGDMMAHIMGRSASERSQKATTQEGFLTERVAKESSEVQDLSEKNNRLEGIELLRRAFQGSVRIVLIDDPRSLFCINDAIVEKLGEIEKRKGQFQHYGESSTNINSNNHMDQLLAWYYQPTPSMVGPYAQEGNNNPAGPSWP